MADLKKLVSAVQDCDSLCQLLDGLDWPLDLEFPFDDRPEIAQGVKGAACTVKSLIPASSDDPRLFLLVEFQEPYVRRDLREILASLRRFTRTTGKWEGKTGTGDTIFVVASPGYEDVRFVLFEEQDRRLPRIRSFGWRKEFIGRTVLTHNLERLRWSDRAHWGAAWDVEGLTEQFYKDYELVFGQILSHVQGTSDDKVKHNWTQQLFNRLLFVAFIQRMGWLKAPNGTPDGYLFDLWKRHKATSSKPKDYSKDFHQVLDLLWFSGLDSPNGVGGKSALFPILGEVPYLNGGLFSRDPALDISSITLPDSAFDQILGEPGGLFTRYNFTVTESTPLDQEVAVDPEMLGKIFERLIIASERHQSGTYYTPRPIVEFMVNEALKGYLTERGLAPEKAEMLVDQDKIESDDLSFKPSEMQDALDWLTEVRAVDPACGSGAYLLMLLQRLFELVDRLEVVQGKGRIAKDAKKDHLYRKKLEILQRCVYGVDLNETAIRIARLRLWLSLVVENKGERPDPLPSFDFLIMRGDTLASPVKPDQHALGYPTKEIREYAELKRKYFHPDIAKGEVRPTKDEMDEKRKPISQVFADEFGNSQLRAECVKRYGEKAPFDWEVEFAEVFEPLDSPATMSGRLDLGAIAGRGGQAEFVPDVQQPGFDIVVANPPYVNSGELLKEVTEPYKKALVKAYPEAGSGTADLLIFFFERAMQLLRPGGQLAFITSNKWLKAGYGKVLRKYFAKQADIRDLIDFHDGKVFQNVICYPLITIAAKRKSSGKTVYTNIPRPERDDTNPDLHEYRRRFGNDLPKDALGISGEWRLEVGDGADRLDVLRCHSTLKQYLKEGFYSGIKTGYNDAFIIGEADARRLCSDSGTTVAIKKWRVGTNIRRWKIAPSDKFVVYTAVLDGKIPQVLVDHFRPYRDRLEARAVPMPYWQLQQAQNRPGFWDQPKIVFPDIAPEPRFALDSEGIYFDMTAFALPSKDLYLLGVLNSAPAFEAFLSFSAQIRGGYCRFKRQYVEQIPIPKACAADRAAIESLVQRILDAKSLNADANVSDLEDEIDKRVEFLYFHHGERGTRKNEAGEEVPYPDTYDEWLALQEAEKGTVVEEVRNLLKIGHETVQLECKSTFSWGVRQEEFIDGLKDEVHTAICALLNAIGGDLLVGVEELEGDVLNPRGVEEDLKRYGGKDGLISAIEQPLGKTLTPNPIGLVDMKAVDIDGKTVIRIHVTPDNTERYRFKDQIYVRRNTKSKPALTADEAAVWWPKRKAGEV